MTLQETTQGAKNRALSAAAAEKSSSEALLGQPPCGLLGMGIESGLFEVEGKMFDICCCAIFDGTEHHIGSEPLRTSQRARPGCAPCVCARCAAYPFPPRALQILVCVGAPRQRPPQDRSLRPGPDESVPAHLCRPRHRRQGRYCTQSKPLAPNSPKRDVASSRTWRGYHKLAVIVQSQAVY